MGLSIAHDLARAQGGDLTAESVSKDEAGTGAIFRLRLPGAKNLLRAAIPPQKRRRLG